MSSGVSDQVKLYAGTAKNAEEQNIPWSQQVDEVASNENLDSPINEDDSQCTNPQSASTQFQYPPFNLKDEQQQQQQQHSSALNSYKTRKSISNFDKKYFKPTHFNNKRDDYQSNAWASGNSRGIYSDNDSNNANRGNHRYEDRRYDNYNSDKYNNKTTSSSSSNANIGEEDKRTYSSSAATTTTAKKTTWASIASQPAKFTSRTTLTSFSQKKKGPGMPPPPMVPGKHNLDVNVWDMPNNNPQPPVPSPPPQPPNDPGPGTGIDLDFPAAGMEHNLANLGPRPSEINYSMKTHGGILKDDNRSNYDGGYGRIRRNSPNSNYNKKNWSSNQGNKQSSGNSFPPPSSQSMRQYGGSGGGEHNSNLNRYPEQRRRDNQPMSRRYDQQNELFNNNDENTFQIREQHRDRDRDRDRDHDRDDVTQSPQAVLNELRVKNNYNPAEIDLEKASLARFFVIKSYSEDDIHRSIKYEIWCSTDHGNKRLDDAFKERQKEGGNILLFFSVNGSGHFCGMAEMITAVDYNSTSRVWAQDKWKGKFKVKWIYVKDVPNNSLRHIILENNDNKPVTNSRDVQEVPNAKGIEVLRILHSYEHLTSLFDDFYHYEKKQEEKVLLKKPSNYSDGGGGGGGGLQRNTGRPPNNYRQNDERDHDGRGGGAMPGRHYANNLSFRDKNNIHRGGGGNNYNNEHRRPDSKPSGGIYNDRWSDYNRDDLDNRDNHENSGRYMMKNDYNRRGGDDRPPMMMNRHQTTNNRQTNFQEDQHNNSTRNEMYGRTRSGGDIQK